MLSQAPNDLLSFIRYFKDDYLVNWHHEAICDRLSKLKHEVGKKIMIFVGPQRGKMLWDETPVLTPNGFKKHGDLVVGDTVYDDKAQERKVIAIGEKTVCNVRLRFSNGQVFYTHMDHEWKLSINGQPNIDPFVVPTSWLFKTDKYGRDKFKARYIDARGEYHLAYYTERPSIVGPYKEPFKKYKWQKDIPRQIRAYLESGQHYDGPKIGNCIQVEGGIYLAGEKLVPTHNSEIVSRNFPAWWLGNFPGSKNIMSSYSADLANSFNRDAQQIIFNPEYRKVFPEVKTAKDEGFGHLKAAQNEIETSRGGYIYSTGVGGSTTGRAAGTIGSNRENIQKGWFICDDPIKDLADAFSEAGQVKRWEWWQAVVNTRVHKTSHTILMHTRWAQNDVAGTLISQDALNKGWEILSFPELGPDPEFKNEYDPRTHPDEPLWPDEKGDYEALQKVKDSVGSYTWSALFQQKPVVAGGNLIKDDWINYYTRLPFDIADIRSFNIVQSWDLTFKETQKGSYVVGVTIVKHEANFYVVDIFRKRCNIMDTMRAIMQMSSSWPMCNKILVEEKANGAAIIDLLKNNLSGLIPVKADASKDERLMSVAPFFEAGNVYLDSNNPLTKEIVHELTSFPTCPHDDIVDAISQGLNRFNQLRGLARLKASVHGM